MHRSNIGGSSDRPQRVEPDFSFINRDERPGEARESRPARGPSSFCVLVVEDNPLVLQTLESSLQDAGIDVVTADRGDTALEIFKAHASSIDAVVADECIPLITGRELVQQLQRLKPGLKAILTSGYFGDDYEPPRFGSPDSVFLHKPFNIPQLIEILHRWTPKGEQASNG